jgi:hypothetical protein
MDYKIIKNNGKIQIQFKYPAVELINSLLETHLIKGGSTDETYKTITFKAYSIKQLTLTKIGTNDIVNMITSLSLQLDYLIREKKTFVGYHPNNIYIINESIYVNLDNDLLNIDEENGNIMVSYPFKSNDFFLPIELLNVKTIPHFVHFKTSYFSLGLLVIYSLCNENKENIIELEFYREYLRENNIINILNNNEFCHIKHSKIFYFLSNCLIENIKERSLIYF